MTEMNAHTPRCGNRQRRSGARRALAAMTAMAATVTLVAACGGNSPPGATGSTQYDKALAFSKCMRSHGALGFPDPTSAGTITVTQALLHNPQIQSAAPSCRKLLPSGAVQIPAALQRKMDAQALEYSACMRSHGVPNFPDPIIHGDTIGFRIAAQSPAGGSAPQVPDGTPGSQSSGGGHPKSSSGSPPPMPPQFQAANRACQHLMPGS